MKQCLLHAFAIGWMTEQAFAMTFIKQAFQFAKSCTLKRLPCRGFIGWKSPFMACRRLRQPLLPGFLFTSHVHLDLPGE